MPAPVTKTGATVSLLTLLFWALSLRYMPVQKAVAHGAASD
ncbi:hypothetical protein CFter6_3948 [Collimonas fungivorans]|uniref:Uncharacterized protein n=1 Tax=Collimonas fungivorans TaxID=158899 RepID=A0A127PFQ5_9BURK|nr:hypothetical protein [Collimonas fungivorans]AMO96563.1 hypothetical protein CFter6_3948 [Collimonas fungivorans]